jgi:hypothetical protein
MEMGSDQAHMPFFLERRSIGDTWCDAVSNGPWPSSSEDFYLPSDISPDSLFRGVYHALKYQEFKQPVFILNKLSSVMVDFHPRVIKFLITRVIILRHFYG